MWDDDMAKILMFIAGLLLAGTLGVALKSGIGPGHPEYKICYNELLVGNRESLSAECKRRLQKQNWQAPTR